MQERLSRFSRDQDGSALLEGAVIVPILLIFVLGVYEFSWFFYQQHLVSTGLRDAARYLARVSTSCVPATQGWTIAVGNAVRLATNGSLTVSAPRVKGWTDRMVSVDCRAIANTMGPTGTSTYRGGPAIYVITVSTRFADPSLGFLGLLGLSAPTISEAHSERMIGPG
jgi:Flp pilus assembly protein TadG